MNRAGQPSQGEQILAALKAGKKITGMDALKDFKCWSLPQRIHELRRAGHSIGDQFIRQNGKQIKEYFYAAK